MSLQRCQTETTSTEFLDWQQYLVQEINFPRKQDYYLAQIAAEVRRVMNKNPNSIKVEDLLMKFEGHVDEEEKPTPIDKETRTASNKSKWFGITGYKKKPGE